MIDDTMRGVLTSIYTSLSDSSYANVSFHYFILLDFFNINSFIFSFLLFFYSFRALTFLFARHKGYKIEYLQMPHKSSTYKIEYFPMLHKTSTLPLNKDNILLARSSMLLMHVCTLDHLLVEFPRIYPSLEVL